LDKSTLYTQVTEWETAEDVNERAHQGCFVTGLYIEGASWDVPKSCLTRQKPKSLIQQLPVMKVIPIESHKLKLQVKKIFYRKFLNVIFFLEYFSMSSIRYK
jgi:dynein heavy chain